MPEAPRSRRLLARPHLEASLEGDLQDVDAHQLRPRVPEPPSIPPAARLPFPRRPIAREELERRRRWAASGWLPPQFAARFTSGELAALSVVASYTFSHGAFAWSHDRLARAAGVSVSIATNALREARRLGLVVSAEERRSSPYRHRPNVVLILSHEWAAWAELSDRLRRPEIQSLRAHRDKSRS